MPSQCMKVFQFTGVTSFVVFCMLYGVYQYQYFYNGNYYYPYNSYQSSSSSSSSSYAQQYAQYLAQNFGSHSQYASQYGSSSYGSSRVQPGSQPQYAYQQYSTGGRQAGQRTYSRRSPAYGYARRTTGRRSNSLRRSGLPDLVPDAALVQTTAYTENVPLYRLQCAKSEKCLSSSAYSRTATQDSVRRLLRFSQRTTNEGDADFLPDSDPSQWEWHSCHHHHHSMEVFAHYLLLDVTGARAAEGHKASFCLEDTQCSFNYLRKYDCDLGSQGISAGCWDTYKHDIDCQWIDITDVKPGKYILEISINPERRVRESSFDNNRITCDVRLYRNSVQVYNCIRTHLRSSRG
ncbi:protein-lysine 6-oxidase-like isoform X2 [Branchiostoma floridae]|uniref:Protein-lysine 6-oxidase-like isoform X2 n=1 Tax=Branchiostoma floridae TaxID=7739 RepID=A0A9J7L2W2_BRAFL|nr:protein-lysine 6-oxidase-like isoform X2 [Branchiostoma floridae]